MCPQLTALVLVIVCNLIESRVIYFLEENCKSGKSEIHLGSSGSNSTVIIANSRNQKATPGITCDLVVKPVPTFGIVVVVDVMKFSTNDHLCRTYLQICEDDEIGSCTSKKICNFAHEKYPESFNEGLTIHYVTSKELNPNNNFALHLTLTSYKLAYHSGCDNEKGTFFCANHHCIWKGLTCNGYDNCGDNSDERTCPMEWHVQAKIILATFIGITIIFSSVGCAFYFFKKRNSKSNVIYKYVAI